MVFTSNVTFLGDEHIKFLNKRPEHIVGILETHLHGKEAAIAEARFKKEGWQTLHARAKLTGNGTGTTGGAMIIHKASLQSAFPAEAEMDPNGLMQLPETNFCLKHFRICGLHFVYAAIYLNHSIGLTGINMDIVHKLNVVRDGGRRKIIIAGDFNCPPEAWRASGLLELLGLTIITAGDVGTCKTSSGSSLLDYVVCDVDIAPLIGNITWNLQYLGAHTWHSSFPSIAARSTSPYNNC